MLNLSWSTITLGTYAAIDTLSRAKVSDEMQRDISLLSMCTGKTEEHFENISIIELSTNRRELHEFLSKDIQEKYHPIFKCNGRKYKVSESMGEFTGAQLEGISALQLTAETFAPKSHYALSILCKEIESAGFWIRPNKPLSVKERAEDFEKHLPASIGMGIVNFFFLYSQHLYDSVLAKIIRDTEKLRGQLEVPPPISEQPK